MPHALEHQVRDWLARNAALTERGRVLAAVSGGSDSMALLYALHALGYAVEGAHVDHGTRDGASAEDAAFVREQCAALNVPLHETAVDVAALAAESPLSFEEMARNVRYAFFAETARTQEIAVVATAHHADDQAETLLMRLLRGASPRGLAGIPPVAQRDGITIIRPLIDLSRAEIEAYLREIGADFREDASNADVAFLRNRVRHKLLPRLESEFNPELRAGLVRLAEIQRDEDALLQTFTESFLKRCIRSERTFERKAFAAGHRALQRRAVLEMAWQHGVHPDFARVDAAVDFILNAKARQRFDFGNGVQLAAGMDGVAVVPMQPDPPDNREFALDAPGEVEAFGRTVTARFLHAPPPGPLSSYCSPMRQVFDADAAGPQLLVRHRRNGDRIAPLGMEGSRKLKDYFRDAGVPPEERDRTLLIVRGDEVLWIVGGAVSRTAAITKDTHRYLEIEVMA